MSARNRAFLMSCLLPTWIVASVAAAAAAGEAAFDPATIALPRNLVSNPSFESSRAQKSTPDGWSFYANAEYMSLSGQKALHGKRSVVVDRPPLSGIVHVAARQTVPIRPNEEYTLCAWVNVERSNGGSVAIYLDFLNADKRRLLIRQTAERNVTQGWKMLKVSARAPADAAMAQILVPYVDGDMRVFTDCVSLTCPKGGPKVEQGAIRDLVASRPTCSSLFLSWKSAWEHHEVDYRAAGSDAWQKIPNVWSQAHNVILLKPETPYEFKVRGIPPEVIDENGKPVPQGSPVESAVVSARTTAVEPKLWEGLKLWPTEHIASFAGEQCYPCVEIDKDAVYVTEAWRYGVYLSKLRGSDFGVEWTKQLVPPVKKVPSYQGIPDTCIFQGKLWVMWNRQGTGDPRYQIMDSRQLVLTYDLATGAVSEPIEIESTRPGCGTWEGGLTVFRDKIWMMWLEVWLNDQGRRRTRIVVRPYENGRFTDTLVFDNCPSVYPYGPSINVFGDRMILLWSDLAVGEKESESEPLYCTFFDGKTFSQSTLVHEGGRSRYAKGAQWGDDFYCVYKCNTQHPGSGYMYHDLALTKIGPQAKQMVTTYWVDDVKYNSSPDMTRAKDGLLVVYGKFEHAYGRRHDPAVNHGSFIGRITK